MAKKLKFNLIVDGVRCKNVEDIQNNFNILDLIEYFKNGKLIKWAKVRDLDDLIQEIENIQSDDNLEIAKKLCRIFTINCSNQEILSELSMQNAQIFNNTQQKGNIDKIVLNKLKYLEKRLNIIEEKIGIKDISNEKLQNMNIKTKQYINSILLLTNDNRIITIFKTFMKSKGIECIVSNSNNPDCSNIDIVFVEKSMLNDTLVTNLSILSSDIKKIYIGGGYDILSKAHLDKEYNSLFYYDYLTNNSNLAIELSTLIEKIEKEIKRKQR